MMHDQQKHFLRKFVSTFILAIVVVSVCFWAAYRFFDSTNRKDSEIEVRAYTVESGSKEDLVDALGRALALAGDGKHLGSVTLTPNGQLLITAPRHVQSTMGELLKTIASSIESGKPAMSFEGWIVRSTDGNNIPSTLQEINDALSAIQSAQGSQGFELVEKLALNVRSGRSSMVRGNDVRFDVLPDLQTIKNNESAISARLKLSFNDGRGAVETDTELSPNQTLIIGQSNRKFDSAANAQRVYYIVRVKTIQNTAS